MSDSRNTVPTSIVDVNGKQTTVHRNATKPVSSLRLSGAKPMPRAASKEEIREKQLIFANDYAYDVKDIFPGTTSIEIGSRDDGSAYIVSTLDADGNPTSLSDDYGSDSVEAINRGLRAFSYNIGIGEGFITANEPNDRGALYTFDLNKAESVAASLLGDR